MTSALLVLEAAAITIVVTKGSIFKRLREVGPWFWRELSSCPLCAGVWIGAGWYLLHQPLPPSSLRGAALEALGTGVVTGVLALLIARILNALEKYSDG